MKKTCDLRSWEYESVIKWILRNEKNMTWGHGSMNLLSNKYLEMKKKNMTWGHGSMNLLSNKYLEMKKNMWLEIMGVWICYQMNT
jgi:hypothetical protein